MGNGRYGPMTTTQVLSAIVAGTVAAHAMVYVRAVNVYAIDCLDTGTPVQWEDQCRQVQNYWGGRNGVADMKFYYYAPHFDMGVQEIGWRFDRTSFARIHEQFGQTNPSTGRKYTAAQLTYYPDRAVNDMISEWDCKSGLDFVDGSRYKIYASEAHKYASLSGNVGSTAFTEYLRIKPASDCGDGAGANCYSRANTYINGGYGWLPTEILLLHCVAFYPGRTTQ